MILVLLVCEPIVFKSCCHANSLCFQSTLFSVYIFMFLHWQRWMIKWKTGFGSERLCIVLTTCANIFRRTYPILFRKNLFTFQSKKATHTHTLLWNCRCSSHPTCIPWVSLFCGSAPVVRFPLHKQMPSASPYLAPWETVAWCSMASKITLGVNKSVLWFRGPWVLWGNREKKTLLD